jgi:hypothetical protein
MIVAVLDAKQVIVGIRDEERLIKGEFSRIPDGADAQHDPAHDHDAEKDRGRPFGC